jgi:hypothetical protein
VPCARLAPWEARHNEIASKNESVTEVGAMAACSEDHALGRSTYKPAMPAHEAKGRLLCAAMEAAMRKAEPVDEYAETEVLIPNQPLEDRDIDSLSLYAEYESELAREAGSRRDSRARR